MKRFKKQPNVQKNSGCLFLLKGIIKMKKFNESKFTNYLSSLIDDFNNPTTEYDKGAFETLKRIINEFEADHHDQD